MAPTTEKEVNFDGVCEQNQQKQLHVISISLKLPQYQAVLISGRQKCFSQGQTAIFHFNKYISTSNIILNYLTLLWRNFPNFHFWGLEVYPLNGPH